VQCHKKITFKYSDLNIAFTEGTISEPPDSLTLSLEIDNNGYNDIDIENSFPLQISLYQNDFDTQLTPSITPANAYLGEGTGQSVNLALTVPDIDLGGPTDITVLALPTEPWKLRIENIEINSCPGGDCTGTIIAKINSNSNIPECPLHNETEMYCLAEARLRFYTIDYYTWWK